jgi:hypothetical protein
MTFLYLLFVLESNRTSQLKLVAPLTLMLYLLNVISVFADAPRPGGPVPVVGSMISMQFPNANSVVRSAFVPGLDDGFTPQGFARFGPDFLLSGYIHSDRTYCRVYWIGSADLLEKQHFDLPVKCSHAGGIAYSPSGEIIVAEENKLIVWRPLSGSILPSRAISQIAITKGLRGTFLSTSPDGLLLGSFDRKQNVTVVRTFPWKILRYRDISPSDASSTIDLLPRTQGAGRDPQGYLWATSQGNPNLLSLVSPDGDVIESFPFLRGLQGVVCDENGMIWTVSESGAAAYTNRADIYPAIMQIDPRKLTGMATEQ